LPGTFLIIKEIHECVCFAGIEGCFQNVASVIALGKAEFCRKGNDLSAYSKKCSEEMGI
jgi:hypothetical protein